VTIALGLLYQDGVLLCADTEMTGWSMTIHDSKIGYIDRGDVNVGIACAGNAAFSVAAI
jgi:20S proteasome alpha/beta subunit